MTQGSFFNDALSVARDVLANDTGRTRRHDPPTSHEAARKVKAGTHRANVLIALAAALDGLTQSELWTAGGPTHQTGRFPNHAQTRCEELAALGLAHKTGAVRVNTAGNHESVWYATDAGRAVAVELARGAA